MPQEPEVPQFAPLLYFQLPRGDAYLRPSPAVPSFLQEQVISSQKGSDGPWVSAVPILESQVALNSLRAVEDSLHASRQRISEARHPTHVPGRLTREIHSVLDDAAEQQRVTADVAALPTSTPSSGVQVYDSRESSHAPVHVPGFELAVDRTAMAEEAAVKAEEASVRALHLLQAADVYNAEASDLRRQQEKVQEEQRELSEKFFLAETKKKTFERVRGEAEKVAREFEGGKVVEQSMRDLYRDLCADLERLQEATESKRKAAQNANDTWNERKEKLLGAKRDLEKLEAEVSSMEEAQKRLETEVAEAHDLVEATSRRLEAARKKRVKLQESESKAHAAVEEAEERAHSLREATRSAAFHEGQNSNEVQGKSEGDGAGRGAAMEKREAGAGALDGGSAGTAAPRGAQAVQQVHRQPGAEQQETEGQEALPA